MKKLVIIFAVSASTDMIVIILQGRDKIMNDKMTILFLILLCIFIDNLIYTVLDKIFDKDLYDD